MTTIALCIGIICSNIAAFLFGRALEQRYWRRVLTRMMAGIDDGAPHEN
jgi:uncharacterized membrane protein YdjX (TVP38/TMEM64 family)